jgi:hypothetical protein
MLTFGIRQPRVCGLSSVSAVVRVSWKAPLAVADEGVPVGVEVGGRDLCRGIVGGEGEVGQLLEPNDLVRFWLRYVQGLLLLQLVAVGAVCEVVAVGNAARTKMGKEIVRKM